MDQVTNGVAVRMAVLFLLVNRVRQASTDTPALALEEPQPERLRRKAG
jgi:hypothetical protein